LGGFCQKEEAKSRVAPRAQSFERAEFCFELETAGEHQIPAQSGANGADAGAITATQSDAGGDRWVAAGADRRDAKFGQIIMEESRTITRKSASNLALAFVLLPKAKRDGMSALYAFCREIDDLADDETIETDRRRSELSRCGKTCGWLATAVLLKYSEPGTANRSSTSTDCRSTILMS